MLVMLLSEASLEDIKNRIPLFLSRYFKEEDQEQSLKTIQELVSLDPTKGKYSDWIIKNYMSNNIIIPEDNEKITKLLSSFISKQSKLDNKDINSYSPGSLARILDQQFGLSKSERKQARHGTLKLLPGSKLIGSVGEYDVVEIMSPEASSVLCSGTNWCTANKGPAQQYLDDGQLFIVYQDSQRHALVHLETDQVMDVYNEPINGQERYDLLDIIHQVGGPNWKQITRLCYVYARDVIKDRWPEAEPKIIKDPEIAYVYARDVIEDRWPEAEPIIIKDQEWAYRYARDVIKGRWPEAEPEIIKDLEWAYYYAHEVIKGRWLVAEPTIIKDPEWAYWYTFHVIKGRWREAEPIIIKDPEWVYYYALNVIKGRWPEAEPTIMKDPYWACDYAYNVIKGRWPEAESTIMKDSILWDKYKQHNKFVN